MFFETLKSINLLIFKQLYAKRQVFGLFFSLTEQPGFLWSGTGLLMYIKYTKIILFTGTYTTSPTPGPPLPAHRKRYVYHKAGSR